MNVEVVFARPERQVLVSLELPPEATVGLAIERSGLLERFPEIDWASHAVGVFGRVGTREQALNDGDRVEIYRPLRLDPQQARRLRAEHQRTAR